MLNWVKRQWFLCVLFAILAAGYYLPAPGLFIKKYFPLRYMVGTVLFFSAYSLATKAIIKAFTSIRSLLSIVLLGYAVVPFLAFIAMKVLFGPENDYGVGLLVIASAPSTLASAIIWTRLGGGNDAMALAGTMLMNLLGFIAAPIILQLCLGRQVSLNMLEMGRNLFFTLLLPVLIGQAARAARPSLSDRLKDPISVLNRIIILLTVLTVVSRAAEEAGQRSVSTSTLLLVVAAAGSIHSLTLLLGWFGGRFIGIKRRDRIAVALTGSQKTLPVGMYIAEGFFPAYPFAILPVLFYHAMQLVIDSFIVDVWKRKAKNVRPDPHSAAADGLSSEAPTGPREDECSNDGAPTDTAPDHA